MSLKIVAIWYDDDDDDDEDCKNEKISSGIL